MNNREERFLMQAAEHARERAVRGRRSRGRIADEIIDRIIAENPSDPGSNRAAGGRRSPRAGADGPRRANRGGAGPSKTGSLPGIRRALMLKTISVPPSPCHAPLIGSATQERASPPLTPPILPP